jgi:anti-sigma factor RsiW
MNEINNSPDCERAQDLIAFLYDETSEKERRDFEVHLNHCRTCRQEVSSFGVVRETITAWRDEALSGFVSTPLTSSADRKSAVAALRQFFALSPLWLKGATGFAAVILCVLAALAAIKVPTDDQVVTTNPNPSRVYTEQDVDRIVKEALAKQEHEKTLTVKKQETVTTAQTLKPRKTVTVARSQRPLSRPLSRAEREQLAADLRLLSTQDDGGLTLLGDRINQ